MSETRVPRRLPFVTIKRNIPRFRDSYGHWWIEVDGTESYGWWSMRCPLSVSQVIVGTIGTLNGVGGDVVGGTPTTDPRHGEDADFAFHPLLLNGKSDDEVRDEIRHLATSYGGRWGWPWWWCRTRMTNCHTFQLDLFAAIGLHEGSELLYTRGPGCPFMFVLRQIRWRIADALTVPAGARSRRLARIESPTQPRPAVGYTVDRAKYRAWQADDLATADIGKLAEASVSDAWSNFSGVS